MSLGCWVTPLALAQEAIAPPHAGQPGSSVGSPAAPPEGSATDAAISAAERRGRALKEQGDAQFRARQYLDAVATYDRAYAAHPDVRVLYNKGRALEALGRYAEALSTLRRFEGAASPELRARLQGLSGLMEQIAQRVGALVVRVDVPGAQVVWGDQVLGTTPLSGPVLVNAGVAKLQVLKEGFFPFEQDVTVQGGGSTSFDVTLKSKARHGKLVVDSAVSGASISVDDRRIGVAPTEVLLVPGTHRVTARRRGYEDATTQVVLEAGQHRSITLDPFVDRPAIYERWWFWGGITALAAGTATAIILLNQDPETSRGDFSPDTIQAGAPAFRF